jgi:hypothetical protein
MRIFLTIKKVKIVWKIFKPKERKKIFSIHTRAQIIIIIIVVVVVQEHINQCTIIYHKVFTIKAL